MPKLRLAGALLVAIGAATVLYGCGEGLVLPDEGEPAAIIIVAGDAQSGTAGSELGLPLIVRVTDSRGRPIANQQVVFTLENGSGDVIPDTAETDADGRASTNWTLGPSSGNQAVRAAPVGAPGSLAVMFNATALAGQGAALVLVSGDGQTAAVGSALPDSLLVKVSDPLGNPVAGVQVSWTAAGGGTISPAQVTTGPDGLA
ncbi:MAG: Ig-like domain-containing protein, partial [Gemmatimonadales bacterium]